MGAVYTPYNLPTMSLLRTALIVVAITLASSACAEEVHADESARADLYQQQSKLFDSLLQKPATKKQRDDKSHHQQDEKHGNKNGHDVVEFVDDSDGNQVMGKGDLTMEQMDQLKTQHASKNVAAPKRWAAPKHDGMGKDDLTSKQMDKRTSGSSKNHAAPERWAAPKHDGMGKGDLTIEQMNQLTKQHAAKNVAAPKRWAAPKRRAAPKHRAAPKRRADPQYEGMGHDEDEDDTAAGGISEEAMNKLMSKGSAEKVNGPRSKKAGRKAETMSLYQQQSQMFKKMVQ